MAFLVALTNGNRKPQSQEELILDIKQPACPNWNKR